MFLTRLSASSSSVDHVSERKLYALIRLHWRRDAPFQCEAALRLCAILLSAVDHTRATTADCPKPPGMPKEEDQEPAASRAGGVEKDTRPHAPLLSSDLYEPAAPIPGIGSKSTRRSKPDRSVRREVTHSVRAVRPHQLPQVQETRAGGAEERGANNNNNKPGPPILALAAEVPGDDGAPAAAAPSPAPKSKSKCVVDNAGGVERGCVMVEMHAEHIAREMERVNALLATDLDSQSRGVLSNLRRLGHRCARAPTGTLPRDVLQQKFMALYEFHELARVAYPRALGSFDDIIRRAQGITPARTRRARLAAEAEKKRFERAQQKIISSLRNAAESLRGLGPKARIDEASRDVLRLKDAAIGEGGSFIIARQMEAAAHTQMKKLYGMLQYLHCANDAGFYRTSGGGISAGECEEFSKIVEIRNGRYARCADSMRMLDEARRASVQQYTRENNDSHPRRCPSGGHARAKLNEIYSTAKRVVAVTRSVCSYMTPLRVRECNGRRPLATPPPAGASASQYAASRLECSFTRLQGCARQLCMPFGGERGGDEDKRSRQLMRSFQHQCTCDVIRDVFSICVRRRRTSSLPPLSEVDARVPTLEEILRAPSAESSVDHSESNLRTLGDTLDKIAPDLLKKIAACLETLGSAGRAQFLLARLCLNMYASSQLLYEMQALSL